MAGDPTMAAGGETLKCNKWVLKVPIHCLGCTREIKKLLHSIDGVYTTSIDPQQQQVTVTGNIDSETLLRKLSKTGKHAEICAEKSVEKCKKNEKPTEAKTSQNKEQITPTTNAQKKPSKPEIKAPTKDTNGKKLDKKGSEGTGAAAPTTAGECRKMKKGKGQKGNCAGDGKCTPASTGLLNADQGRSQGGRIQVHQSPTFEQLEPIMSNGGSQTVQVLSYNAAYLSKAGHGVSYPLPPASAYISHNSSNGVPESYQAEATAFNSFDIFSDENPNGCTVM